MKKLIISSNIFLAGVMVICTVLIMNRPGTGWIFFVGLFMFLVGLVGFTTADVKNKMN